MLHYFQSTYGSMQPWMALLLIWALVWKGLALWKAAHKEQKGWFVALLIINTAGILEILYLYVFSKAKHSVAEAPAHPQQ